MNPPVIIDKTFSDKDYSNLKNYIISKNIKSLNYDKTFGRYSSNDTKFDEYAKILLPIARKIFNSATLVPSYSMFAYYEGDSSLFKHKDTNACTYTIDFCFYQNRAWGLWVDGKEYILNSNQSLAYYGNDQEHWRESIPDKESQHVAMIFFHFVEPDHWWVTKGRSYLDVITGKLSEEEWEQKNRPLS